MTARIERLVQILAERGLAGRVGSGKIQALPVLAVPALGRGLAAV